jgi:uncharacterized Ntn-hydrolase superfamily protein
LPAGTVPPAVTFSLTAAVPAAAHGHGDGEAYVVGVATDAPAVGALCPFVSEHGAVATQAFVNVRLGRRGVALLEDLGVESALGGLLERDPDSALRQLHGVDGHGGTFAATGDDTDPWAGHEVRPDRRVTAAGNMLVGPDTLSAAADAFLDPGAATAGPDPTAADVDERPPGAVGPDRERALGERVLDALAAGQAGGGDERGHTSAALAVWAPSTTAYHDLRVDAHADPVAELRRVYRAGRAAPHGVRADSKSRIID